jgi:hypothetical protein
MARQAADTADRVDATSVPDEATLELDQEPDQERLDAIVALDLSAEEIADQHGDEIRANLPELDNREAQIEWIDRRRNDNPRSRYYDPTSVVGLTREEILKQLKAQEAARQAAVV